jgi:hypothetical protein
VNPLNAIPTWFGMLLNFALPSKAEDGDTAGGMVRNGVREAIPQALNIVVAKAPFVPKAFLGEGLPDVEAPLAPETSLPSLSHNAPGGGAAHAAPETAPSVQANLAQSVRTASTIDKVSQLLKGNRLCKENPALCATFLREMAADGDMHTLYVPSDVFAQTAQKTGIAEENLLGRMPGANSENGLVSIPADQYFTVLPPDMAQELAAFAKTAPDGSSLVEALEQARGEAVGNGGMADAKAPAEAEIAASAETEADAANSARGTQPGDGQDTTVQPSGHPLLDARQWEKYQKELRAMSPEDRAIAERFAEKLRDYDAAVAEYATLKGSHGGKVLNTDIARELSPDYLADRTKSEVVQRLASAFVRKMYADKLAATKDPIVLFSAGGPESGKSTVLDTHSGMAKAAANADIVYDTTMSDYGSAKGMIEQVLDAGGGVQVALIIREPLDALKNGAIRRAVEQEKEYGSGRTVTLDYFLNAHPSAIRNVFRLAEEYKDHPDVKFRFMDNTHGKEDISEVSLEQAKQIEFKDVEARARALLEKEYRDGRISKKIYQGFKFGKDVP